MDEDKSSADAEKTSVEENKPETTTATTTTNSVKATETATVEQNGHHEYSKDKANETEQNVQLENGQDSLEKLHFRVEPVETNHKHQFKLRIVPLEKLLAKPALLQNVTTKHSIAAEKRKKNQNSTIELIDSSDTSSESVSGRGKTSKSRPKSRIVLNSSSSEDEVLPISKRTNRTATIQSNGVTKSTAAKESVNSVAVAAATEAKKTATKVAQINIQKTTGIKRCVVRLKRIKIEPHKIAKALAPQSTNNTTLCTKPSTSAKAVAVVRPQKAKSPENTQKKKVRRISDSSASSAQDDDDDEMNAAAKSSSSSRKPDSAAGTDNDGTSSDNSEIIPARKRRVFTNRQQTKSKSDDSAQDSDFEPDNKKPRKLRRIQKESDSSDEDDDDDDDEKKQKNKRKDIRKLIKSKDLDVTTKSANKEEEERRKRIEERQKIYNQIYEKPDSVEVSELIFDFDEETKQPLLQVDKGLLKKLKPHQVTGVKFMWDACFETLEAAAEKPGSGCILAHCMGLGKTLQIVTLTHTLLANSRRSHVERALIISPLSTLNNWAREFKYWMGFAKKKNLEIYDMSRFKDKATRIFKLNEWFEEGGVCIIGYDMYRILSNEKAKGLRKNQRETLQKSLVDPGPDLVVCDEGHLLKNEKTSISKAVTNMRTKRRIVLTGTPLQNNLKEYYCMIQFIKPNLLGTYKEYLNRFVNPITNGQYTDSTERDIRLMKHRSHILHKMLEGCIQRRDYSVLAPYLPPKHEYVVYTTLSPLQQKLYDFYMNTQRELTGYDVSGKGAKLFQDFQDLRRIWTHPMNLRVNSDSVIRKRVLANDSDSMEDFICDDEDDDEASNGSASDTSIDSSKSFASGGGGGSSKAVAKAHKTRNHKLNADYESDTVDEIVAVQQDDPSEWWKRFVEDSDLNNINHSPKLVILMRLLEQCELIGDKLLVFSQSLQSLDVIEHFLSLIDSKTKGNTIEGDICELKGIWKPGIDYFRLDGSCSVDAREAMCKKFNNVANLRARLFLISTRAGGLGINLVAANRVVIFDVSWNPSHDTQSIFRVYRFGQDKPCYIYRLIAMGTMEQKLYERQVAKQATAKRVIDEQQISRHYNQSDLQELYTYELQPSTERQIPILPKDRLFAELLVEHDKLLFKYHEHDLLLENEESENLSEDERKAAWDDYEAEKTRSVQTSQYMSYDRGAFGGQLANPSGSVTSNKIFGFRSDVLLKLLNMKISQDIPSLNQNQIVQLVPSYLQRLYNEMNNNDPTMYKDLLSLHASLAQPSGMYMSPLLFANQEVNAAGYFQAPIPQQLNNTYMAPRPPAPGFEPDKVYELD